MFPMFCAVGRPMYELEATPRQYYKQGEQGNSRNTARYEKLRDGTYWDASWNRKMADALRSAFGRRGE
jgi:ribosome modulation factor